MVEYSFFNILSLLYQGVHETRFQEDNDYTAKIEMLEAELDEALDANNKYRLQLQRYNWGGNSSYVSRSKVPNPKPTCFDKQVGGFGWSVEST